MNTPSDHWISELIRTIQECRAENLDQRFGQLLYNIIATDDPKASQESFHTRLFYLRDEELVKLLKNYKEKGL